MSRIGNKTITIPDKVEVNITDGGEYNYKLVTVKGPKGELSQSVRQNVKLELEDKELNIKRVSESKESKALHGLYRSLISNMIKGVTEGYKKELHIEGIGYRAQMLGSAIELSLGFSHKIVATPPTGVVVDVKDQTEITIEGIDKQKVGEFAAQVRGYRPPEPYKGKGVRYKDEQIRRKDVKSAK